MIAVASTVVLFFKDEQHMVSKFNLLYVVYRTGQITVGRMMKTDGVVDFFVVLSGMSLSPTSKTFWPFLQDPLCQRPRSSAQGKNTQVASWNVVDLCIAAVEILESYPEPFRCLQERHFPDTAGW